MPNAVKPIPDGYHAVTPYFTVPGAAKLIDFLKEVFDAVEIERMGMPDGTVMHAELRIGDSVVMMGDARGESKPRTCQVYVYLKDVDLTYQKAVAAGALSLRKPETMFYGDRTAGVEDAWGNLWWLGTHVEDVAPDELKRRATAMAAHS